MLTCLTSRRIYYSCRRIWTSQRGQGLRRAFSTSGDDEDKLVDISTEGPSNESTSLWTSDSSVHRLRRPRIYKEVDLLGEAIFKANELPDLVDLIKLHSSVMSNRHLSMCFKSLSKLTERDSLLTDHVKSLPEFHELCTRTVEKLRYFEVKDLMALYKCMVYMRVQARSRIMQSTLQMIRQYLNDFSLRELIFLEFLLSKQLGTTPLSEALNMAIVMVVDVKISSKELDLSDAQLVARCLKLLGSKNGRIDTINLLMRALNLRKQDITLSDVPNIFSALANFPVSADSRFCVKDAQHLLNVCSELVCSFSAEDIDKFVPVVVRRLARGNYYHQQLYQILASWLLRHLSTVQLDIAYDILSILGRNDHVDVKLLDEFYLLLVRHHRTYVDSTFMNPAAVMGAYSLLPEYKPSFEWSSLVALLSVEEKILQQTARGQSASLIFFLKRLAAINFVDDELFSRIVCDHLQTAFEKKPELRKRLLRSAILVNYVLSTRDTNNEKLSEARSTLEPFVNEAMEAISEEYLNSSTYSSIKPYLELALGGPDFSIHSVWTSTGLFIPHFLVMRKGEYPVSLGKSSCERVVDDIDVPLESKKLAIVGLTPRNYCRKPYKLKNDAVLHLNGLRNAGITPVCLDVMEWESLSQREKIPRLMNLIQTACNEELQCEIVNE